MVFKALFKKFSRPNLSNKLTSAAVKSSFEGIRWKPPSVSVTTASFISKPSIKTLVIDFSRPNFKTP